MNPPGRDRIEGRARSLIGDAIVDSGWMDGEGERSEPHALARAHALIADLLALGAPAPRVYPTLAGGVQLEWDSAGSACSITIEPGQDIRALRVLLPSGIANELVVGDGNAGILAGFLGGALPA